MTTPANAIGRHYLASATMRKAVKTRAKTLSSISDQVWLLNEVIALLDEWISVPRSNFRAGSDGFHARGRGVTSPRRFEICARQANRVI